MPWLLDQIAIRERPLRFLPIPSMRNADSDADPLT
jgi:hypothetical protein